MKKETQIFVLYCADDRFDGMPVAFCSPCLIHKKDNKVSHIFRPSGVFFFPARASILAPVSLLGSAEVFPF